MEENNERFEKQAMKYVDWGKQKPVEVVEVDDVTKPIESTQPDYVDEIVEETREENEDEKERREREKYIEEIKEKQKKANEEELEKLKKIKENMTKQYQDVLKGINFEEAIEEMKNIKTEDIVTPESDKVFFAWLESRFPKLVEEVKEEVRIKKEQKIKEYEKMKEDLAKEAEKHQGTRSL